MISNMPYKGTYDYFPKDLKVLSYIFSVWRKTCESFGYEEYLTPVLENADIYRAKSGEDVGGKELYVLTDEGGRELAIRPEMTPSVTRMVSRVYGELPKPIRYFSIANFYRQEKPQKGRNREFWQLNVDMFGDTSINSDLEIISVAIEMMRNFKAPENSYTLYFNSRVLLDNFLALLDQEPDMNKQMIRLMDKFEKFQNVKDFEDMLIEKGYQESVVKLVSTFLQSSAETLITTIPQLSNSQGLAYIKEVIENLNKLGYKQNVKFKPSVIRGFDYYDGLIFEVFDNNRENPRSLFGGGRYNGLANIFGASDMPAVGFAPGNETLKLFLENWNLLPNIDSQLNTLYMPLLEEMDYTEVLAVANALRRSGRNIELDTVEKNISAALRNANKKGVQTVALYGPEEKAGRTITLKNMEDGSQNIVSLA